MRRRAEVAKRYRECWTLQKIADDIGVSIFTVHEDVKAMLAELGRTAGLDISARIAIELDKINLLENEAWENLRISKRPKFVSGATENVVAVKDEQGAVVLDESGKPRVVVERRSSASEIQRPEGDPRWAMIINQCITRRMKLFGLENGYEDDPDKKKKTANTFEDFVAAHLEQRKIINVTPVKETQKKLGIGND